MRWSYIRPGTVQPREEKVAQRGYCCLQVPDQKIQRRQSQTHKRFNDKQRIQVGTRKIPVTHDEEYITIRAMKHWNLLLRVCGISIFRNVQDWTGHHPEQPDLIIRALSRFGLENLKGPFQSSVFCDYHTAFYISRNTLPELWAGP